MKEVSEANEDTGIAPPRQDVADPSPARRADWGRREFALREWMDGPCTYAAYRAGALDLERVNWWTRGYRPTLQFLERVVARTRVGYEPLHVLDVGCGHGDGLRAMHRWAARRSVPLKLTGVDLNPYAARLARECDRRAHVSAGTITWLTADAFETKLDRPADVVTSSLFAHHLDDDALVQLLRWKEANARVAWMVSDLRRSERAAEGFAWLTRALRMNAMVKHDGAMSFRRALSIADWEAIVKRAGVKAVVRDVGLGRLVVENEHAGAVAGEVERER
jgi:SAM-dependent methyltransferase